MLDAVMVFRVLGMADLWFKYLEFLMLKDFYVFLLRKIAYM